MLSLQFNIVMKKKRALTKYLSILLVFLCSSVYAQGSKEDYERANLARERFSGKIFKETIMPEWSEDGERFTYKNTLPEGRTEFVSVNASKGERTPAFDHSDLAEKLGALLERKFDRNRLPIQGFRLSEDENTVHLRIDGTIYSYDKSEKTLLRAEDDVIFQNRLIPRFTRTRTRTNGDATEVRFMNTLEKELELYWIDSDDKEHPYGNLGPGRTRSMNTYRGHVWAVRDREGKTYGYFTAESFPKEAIISENMKGDSADEPRQNRRGNTRTIERERDIEVVFRNDNIFVRKNGSGEETRLSSDGNPDDRYERPFFFSHDSKHLVVMKTAKGDDRKVYYVESSPKDQLQPKLHSYDYLKPGDKLPITKPHLFRIENSEEIPVSDELFSNPWSISEFSMEKNGKRLFFLYNQRGHQVVRYLALDMESGEVKTISEETSNTFISYTDKIYVHRMDETNELIWLSQRDGWNHLYLIDTKTGKLKNRITRGNWVVRSIERIDPENRVIWFYAGGVYSDQDPYYIHYCRIDFNGENFRILSEGDGTHKIQHSPNRKYFIDTYSRIDMPPVHELRGMEDGRLICVLEKADDSELLKTGWSVPARFVAKGRDGTTDIHGLIIRPSNFDPEKKYPVIENIYAGPHGSFVPKSFQSFYGMNTLSELGFILVQIDGMGTNHRSKTFHDLCWKNLGDSGFPDRILWLKAAAEKYPYMDIERLGIYGGSAGGQSSTRALLEYGDFYKVAVSDCGCHDNRMDKIWWNEQWMGWPIGPHYEEQSNVTQAHRLKGKLLLTVGETDTNVDPASTLQLANALIEADKDFELLIMTGRGHGSGEHPYAQRRRMDFFVRHLYNLEPRHTSEP